MVALMGVYLADIGLLVGDSEPRDELIVYQDLKFTVEKTRQYTPPVVQPENSHLRVVKHHESLRACKEAGLTHIRCDIPAPLEEQVVQHYGLRHAPASDDLGLCLFYQDLPKELPPAAQAQLDLFNKSHQGAVTEIALHPDAGCLELHVKNECANQEFLYNNLLGLTFSFASIFGELRSVNGRRV